MGKARKVRWHVRYLEISQRWEAKPILTDDETIAPYENKGECERYASIMNRIFGGGKNGTAKH